MMHMDMVVALMKYENREIEAIDMEEGIQIIIGEIGEKSNLGRSLGDAVEMIIQ